MLVLFQNILDTRRQILPYEFEVLLGGVGEKIRITNTKGESMVVSRDDITRQLLREDLDTHRRRMYEAARDELRKMLTA